MQLLKTLETNNLENYLQHYMLKTWSTNSLITSLKKSAPYEKKLISERQSLGIEVEGLRVSESQRKLTNFIQISADELTKFLKPINMKSYYIDPTQIQAFK